MRISDGREVLVRPMEAADRATYAAAVAGLSPASRALRFAGPKPALSERELDRLTLVDADHLVVVAVHPVTGEGLGVARSARLEDRRDEAEVAFAVGEDWRGVGLGAALLDEVVVRARGAGLRALVATTLSENARAQELLRAAGFRRVGSPSLMTDFRLEL